jgi:hypothetical protein
VSVAGAVLIFLARYTEIYETLKAFRGAAPSQAQAAAAVRARLLPALLCWVLGALTLLNLAGAEAVAAVSNAAMYLDQCRVIAAIGLRVVCLCAAAGLCWAGRRRRPALGMKPIIFSYMMA